MIQIQRSTDRRYMRSEAMTMWKTFDSANAAEPLQRGFRSLESLNEVMLPPGVEFKFPLEQDRELVTYIREGCLQVRNGGRRDALLRPGSYQRAGSVPSMITPVEPSSASGTRLFLISMQTPSKEADPSCEHTLVPFSERHGRLRLVASPDAGANSLRLRQDVRLYSSVLDEGHHVVHELVTGRAGWLHVISGRVRLRMERLESGDGASVEDETAIAFTAEAPSEILLFDLA